MADGQNLQQFLRRLEGAESNLRNLTQATSPVRVSSNHVIQNIADLKEKQRLLKLKLVELEKEQLIPPTDMNKIKGGTDNNNNALRVSTAQIKLLKANNKRARHPASLSTDGKFSSTIDTSNIQEEHREENNSSNMDDEDSNNLTFDNSLQHQEGEEYHNDNESSNYNSLHSRYNYSQNNNSSLLSDESNTDITDNSSLYDETTSGIFDETATDDDDDNNNNFNSIRKKMKGGDSDPISVSTKAKVSIRNHRMLLNSRITSNPKPRPHQQLLHSTIPLQGHPTKRAPVKLLHFNRDITVDDILKKGKKRHIPVDVITNETQTSGEHFKSKTQETGTTVDLIPPKPATLEMECQTDLPDDLSDIQRQMLSKADSNTAEEEEPIVPIRSGPVMMPPAVLLSVNSNSHTNAANAVVNNDIVQVGNGMSNYYDRHFLDVVDLDLSNLPKSIIQQFDPVISQQIPSTKKINRQSRNVNRKSPIPPRFEDLLPSKIDEQYTKLSSKGKYNHARIYQIEQAADVLGQEFHQSDDALQRLENMLRHEEGVSQRFGTMMNDSVTAAMEHDEDYNESNAGADGDPSTIFTTDIVDHGGRSSNNNNNNKAIVALDVEVEKEMKDAWDLLKELEAHVGTNSIDDGDDNIKP